ncbi:MAG: hypothetical protein RLZZ272_29, partial [Actinomycetota bacterium]
MESELPTEDTSMVVVMRSGASEADADKVVR